MFSSTRKLLCCHSQRDWCYICEDFTGRVLEWIGCWLCPWWCRGKCAHLTGIKLDNLRNITWISSPCLHSASLATNTVEELHEFKQELSNEISVVKDGVESRVLSVKEEMSEVVDVLCADQADSGGAGGLRGEGKARIIILLPSL